MAKTPLRLLLLVAALAASGARRHGRNLPHPDIRALEIRSDVHHRYARTQVFSRVANPANESQEVTFRAVLPDDAFVSSFAITVGGRVYPARVEGREEAQAEYREAVRAGRTAAHVQVSARHVNLFTVALHVAARDKAAFNLTYEQLLARERGRYRLRLMLDPGQVVQRLLVEARIRDSANLTLVRVANLRAADNEVDYAAEEPDDPLATVERVAPTEALVRWEPDEEAQRRLSAGEGLKGLLEVQYDVDRSETSTVLVGDGGYFVHFFSPSEQELSPLPKHVVFLLDVSGSMAGHKLQQLKEAMAAILSEIRANDVFSLLTFSTDTRVWVPGRGFRRAAEDVGNTVVAANQEMIAQAQRAVSQLEAEESTHMFDGLQGAYRAVRKGREQTIPEGDRQSLIIFLTDGQPNGPGSSNDELLGVVTAATSNSTSYAPLYSLAFGSDADFNFLKKLSLRGKGFARKIYEAADAALQLRNFFRRVASPLLSDVIFQYADHQVETASLTQATFPVLLAGTELAVAGHLPANGTADSVGARVRGVARERAALERPATVRRLEPQEVPFVERLWAYLTVRQLLERAHGDDAEAQARARRLALRYAFVTPLTSLVVVKPDNQTSGADLRGDSDSASRDAFHNQALPNYASFLDDEVSRGLEIDIDTEDDDIDGSAPSNLTLRSEEEEYSTENWHFPRFEEDLESTSLNSSVQLYSVVPLANISWLDDGVAGNGSHVFVPIAGHLEAFVVAEPPGLLDLNRRCPPALCGGADCRRGRGRGRRRGRRRGRGRGRGRGHRRGRHGRGSRCVPLARCALQEFAQDFSAFVPRFCPIESHAGVCCPPPVMRSLRGSNPRDGQPRPHHDRST